MKETTTTLYCDATGDEIENKFDMLFVTLNSSMTELTFQKNVTDEVHLKEDVHSFEYEELDGYEFIVYIGTTGTVAMVERSSKTRTFYYGRDTDESAVQELIDVLERDVLGNE